MRDSTLQHVKDHRWLRKPVTLDSNAFLGEMGDKVWIALNVQSHRGYGPRGLRMCIKWIAIQSMN